MTDLSTGSEALALGALDAGVQFVTGYPGSPSTRVFDALVERAPPGRTPRLEWAINEKSALDAALGASLAHVRALVCLKSVGLNVALDSLMVAVLAPGDGGLVILAGDDPGGWGSQNEQDSRLLAAAAEVPLLEPTSAGAGRGVMRQAFELSEAHRLPVVVRITRALATARSELVPAIGPVVPGARSATFQHQPERFNVLPISVVSMHRRVQAALDEVQAVFGTSALNSVAGSGRRGVVAAGHLAEKLATVLGEIGPLPLQVLSLTTLHPLPEHTLVEFMRELDGVLVLEETAPYVESRLQALAQQAGLALPILGRGSGHLPGAGELFRPEIARALAGLLPDVALPVLEGGGRPMPSRQPLCDDCPYIPTLEALLAVMARHGGRERFVVTGETGCMVRAQLPPWQIMDAKYGMGASIGLASGLARAGISQRVVALSGDSAFLHSGLNELIDAVQAGGDLLVVLLENETTALSGGQPHPATAHDALGRARRPVDLPALARATGAAPVWVLDPRDRPRLEAAFDEGLTGGGVAVAIVREACPRWTHDDRSAG
ncbi:MAG: thiamine pyrophosphate-dependent enzyme [Anaerolineae bacterium]|jgi:indolepyruvate ferredoxin oxidoreductase alpha subunit